MSDKGIEVDPSKIKAILEMPPPKGEKEIRGFLGRLQYISRFIAKLTSTCEPIFKLLTKNEPHKWKDECQKAFELIKQYLLHPPILIPPQHGKPLLLYISIIGDIVGSMLAQEVDEKNERAIYYLSRDSMITRLGTPHRKLMLCTCLGCTEVKAHRFIHSNMGGSKNGPIELPL